MGFVLSRISGIRVGNNCLEDRTSKEEESQAGTRPLAKGGHSIYQIYQFHAISFYRFLPLTASFDGLRSEEGEGILF